MGRQRASKEAVRRLGVWVRSWSSCDLVRSQAWLYVWGEGGEKVKISIRKRRLLQWDAANRKGWSVAGKGKEGQTTFSWFSLFWKLGAIMLSLYAEEKRPLKGKLYWDSAEKGLLLFTGIPQHLNRKYKSTWAVSEWMNEGVPDTSLSGLFYIFMWNKSQVLLWGP